MIKSLSEPRAGRGFAGSSSPKPYRMFTYSVTTRGGHQFVACRESGWADLAAAERSLDRIKFGYAEILFRQGQAERVAHQSGNPELKERYKPTKR